MIPKIRTGTDRSYPLIAYLFGPGKHEEHTNQHIVASWNNYAPDPGPDPEPHRLAKLANQLDQPVKALGDQAPDAKIWHCSVRTAPGDRHLDDTEWAAIARRIVHATGIAPDGDTAACRWVAVRHALDHIHIAATLVRQDGRRAALDFDKRKAQAEARLIEKEYGLRQLNPGDGTAAKLPTSQERFKAERTGRTETPRETLRDAVRQAVAGTASEAEFFTRLVESGVKVKRRVAPSGDTTGFAVALPGDRNRAGQPIWFSGSDLAPDLSLPKIRQRLANGPLDTTAPAAKSTDTAGTAARWSPPATARRQATLTAEHTAAVLDTGHDDGTAQLIGVGEVLDALAQTAPPDTRTELRAAARAYERTARSHIRAENADNRALRQAARDILHAGGALGRGEDDATTAMLLSTLVLVAIAAARWHSARGHAQQATAARQTADHLRTAYHQAATTPMTKLHEQGRALPAAQRHRLDTTIRAALPTHQQQPHASEQRQDALAATLGQAEQAGYDPETLLQEAIDQRELDTAQDINDVLVWRLRRLANLPAYPHVPDASKTASSRTRATPNQQAVTTSPRHQAAIRNRPQHR